MESAWGTLPACILAPALCSPQHAVGHPCHPPRARTQASSPLQESGAPKPLTLSEELPSHSDSVIFSRDDAAPQ